MTSLLMNRDEKLSKKKHTLLDPLYDLVTGSLSPSHWLLGAVLTVVLSRVQSFCRFVEVSQLNYKPNFSNLTTVVEMEEYFITNVV